MAIEFENPTVAGTVLIREDIESQNFVAGVSGWEIRADGSAEFNDIVIRDGEVVGGIELYYDGTPAAGNLIASISAVAGVDPYGNGFAAGISTYYRGPSPSFVTLVNGTLNAGSLATPLSAPDIIPAGGLVGTASSTVLLSPIPSGQIASSLVMNSGLDNQRTGSLNVPYVQIADNGANSMTDLAITGSLVQVGMSWHSPTYTASFATGSTAGTYQPLQYRIDGENNLYITGAFHALVAVASAIVFTLPATVGFTKFRPPIAHQIPMTSDSSGGVIKNAGVALQINSAGSVSMRAPAAVAINDNFYVSACIPLGDIS